MSTLCDIRPDLADDLLGNVDQPLQLLKDEDSGKDFLGCDYNRDGDSFRYVYNKSKTRLGLIVDHLGRTLISPRALVRLRLPPN